MIKKKSNIYKTSSGYKQKKKHGYFDGEKNNSPKMVVHILLILHQPVKLYIKIYLKKKTLIKKIYGTFIIT